MGKAQTPVPGGKSLRGSLLLKSPDSRGQIGTLLSQDRHQGDVQLDWARRALCVCVCVHTLKCVPVCLCALRGEEASSRQAEGRPRAKKAAIVKAGTAAPGPREASRTAEVSPACAER